MPYADSQGYKLVTMNELFGYPDNETELLTDDPMSREIIPLQPYTPDYKPLQATTYDYAAYLVQKALIEKGFLTGEPDGVHDTPQGVFFVSEHETDVTLFNQGTVPEGETYEENEYNPEDGWISHVDFWIAYDRGERGFHNADWRWQFGKDDYGTYIYTYYGSHGCINMDYEPARQLFELTELGDAVVIHAPISESGQDAEAELLHSMLAANSALADDGFAICQDNSTEAFAIVRSAPLETLDAETLAEIVAALVSHATKWRQRLAEPMYTISDN
jgi:hypothetical protein